jgi:hypothetical protein
MYRIALHVGNADLDNPAIRCLIEETDALSDVAWETVNGRVLAVVYCDEHDPVGQLVQVARVINHRLDVQADSIDPDLVSISDIANRAGVTREAVRLWVKGSRGPANFPSAAGSVGGGDRGSTQVWSWPVVNEWLEQHFGLGDGDEYLSPVQVAQANAALLRVADLDEGWDWEELVQLDLPVSLEPQLERGWTSSRNVYSGASDEEGFVSVVRLTIGGDA